MKASLSNGLRMRGIFFLVAGDIRAVAPPAPRDWLRLVGRDVHRGTNAWVFAPVGLVKIAKLWQRWLYRRWCVEEIAIRWGFLRVEEGGKYSDGRWTYRFWDTIHERQVKAVARALKRGEVNERARICDIIDRKYFDVTIATESEHQSQFAEKVIRLLGELWKDQVKPDLIHAINAPKEAVPIFPSVRKGGVPLLHTDEDGPEIIGTDEQLRSGGIIRDSRENGSGGIILP